MWLNEAIWHQWTGASLVLRKAFRLFHTQPLNERMLTDCDMMTSSNGNIFRITGHLCGEFTGHRWISRKKGQWRDALMSSLICDWINGWVNNREAGDLRCNGAHYDVTVMIWTFRSKLHWNFNQTSIVFLKSYALTMLSGKYRLLSTRGKECMSDWLSNLSLWNVGCNMWSLCAPNPSYLVTLVPCAPNLGKSKFLRLV